MRWLKASLTTKTLDHMLLFLSNTWCQSLLRRVQLSIKVFETINTWVPVLMLPLRTFSSIVNWWTSIRIIAMVTSSWIHLVHWFKLWFNCPWDLNYHLPTSQKKSVFFPVAPTVENHIMRTYIKGSLSLMAKSDKIHQLHAVKHRVELNTRT